MQFFRIFLRNVTCMTRRRGASSIELAQQLHHIQQNHLEEHYKIAIMRRTSHSKIVQTIHAFNKNKYYEYNKNDE